MMLAVGGREVQVSSAIRLRPDVAVTLSNGPEAAELLLLGGRPMGEPVAGSGVIS